MATERIDIVIREDGARVVNRNLADIGTTAQKSASGVNMLKAALSALAAAFAIDKIIKWADAWATASGAIRIATKSLEEAAAVQDQLFKAAQQSRQGFESVVELYTRVARAGKSLGVSQQELINFSTDIGKALAVQGGSAESAKGALLQLGQALGSGIVRAEEFNSVLEGAPYILQVVANNLKGVNGDIGSLRRLMLDGKLTSKSFFEAFQKGSQDIAADFAKAPLTIGQSFTLINNALTKYVGELDKSLGFSQKVGEAAKFIAENIDQIGAVALSVGAAIAVAFAPSVISAFGNAVSALFRLISAHPFVALAAAVVSVGVYLYQFRDQLSAGIDGITTLGDVGRAVLVQLVDLFKLLKEFAIQLWEGLVQTAQTAYTAISGATNDAVKDWFASFGTFYDGVGTGFAGVVKAVARTVDAIAGLLTGLGIAIYRVVANIPVVFKTFFGNAYNDVLAIVEKLVNVVVDGMNVIRAAAGQDLLETFTLEAKRINVTPYKEIGADIAKAFDDGFAQQGGYVEAWVDRTFAAAQKIAKARTAQSGGGTTADLTKKLGDGTVPPPDEKAIKAAKAFQEALTNLLNTIAPLDGAQREMAKSQALLDKGFKDGKISAANYSRYTQLLKEHYKDILDPLGAVNREIDRQNELLGLEASARQVAEQVYQTTQDLKSKGILLTQKETEALTAQYLALQKLNQATQARDALVAATQGQRDQFGAAVGALGAAQAGKVPGVTRGDVAQQVNGMAPDLFAGTDTAAQAQTAAAEEMYDRLAKLREKDLINEQTYQIARTRVALEQEQQRLQGARDFFGNLAGLQESSNRELAMIGKAAAIAQATIDGYVAVQKALASGPPPYNYVMAAAVGVQAAANVAKIAGFQSGGYTGNMGTGDIAGVVHGKEFVVNAEGTARNRAVLEAMNSGATVAGGGGGTTVVTVNVINNSDGTTVRKQERDTPDGKQLDIIIEQSVSQNIAKGGGIASALESQYSLNRANGARR